MEELFIESKHTKTETETHSAWLTGSIRDLQVPHYNFANRVWKLFISCFSNLAICSPLLFRIAL
jgi:hypothetical protein